MSRTEAERQAVAIGVSLGTTRLDRSAAGEVMTLQRAAWATEARVNDTHQIPPLIETLESVAEGLSRPEVLMWGYRSEAGRLLGIVRTVPTGTPGTVELGRLGVVPDLQGTGVGEAMLALGEARQPAGVTRLTLITGDKSLGNQGFYAAHGWTRDDSVERPGGTVGFSKPRTIGSDRGIGPGPITRDGCAVEVYAELGPQGEPELIAGRLAPGASILELGCGTGRIADPLAAAGFEVTGIDASPDMLSHVGRARAVLAAIEGYDAGRRFDAVVAAGHLINTSDSVFRAALLDTVARQLTPEGVAIFQWHTPAWQDELFVGLTASGRMGPIESRLLVTNAGTGQLGATVGYTWGERSWVHEFVANRIGEDELMGLLAGHGLVFDGWLKPNHGWFTARLA